MLTGGEPPDVNDAADDATIVEDRTASPRGHRCKGGRPAEKF